MSIDPYVYPGTHVLRNKFGIQDAARLHAIENDFAAAQLADLRGDPIPGSYDLPHLQAFHRRIFGDVYDWAGEIVTPLPRELQQLLVPEKTRCS